MPEASQLSPFVRRILEENHFELRQVLRYGPRFACCIVDYGGRKCLLKLVLPLEEQLRLTPADDLPPNAEVVQLIERRLLKEALFLQFLSQELGENGFEPQIITLSETMPVWTLRNFIDQPTMAMPDSDFVFHPYFFTTFTPRQCVEFFVRLQQLSTTLPQSLAELIGKSTSTLKSRYTLDQALAQIKRIPQLSEYADRLAKSFTAHAGHYREYEPVITHYEPYPPHIFAQDGRLSLIDWENIGWGNKLRDLSVLWIRCLAEPKWQAEFLEVMEEYGYFKGHGRLFWESEVIIQSLANYFYFTKAGPIGTAEYDRQAVAFFIDNLRTILTTSSNFKE